MPEERKTTPTPRENSSERLERYKHDIMTDADVVDEQRDQANEDMRFVNVTGGMWEGYLQDTWAVDRAKFEMDMVGDFLNRFLAEWNQSPVDVSFKPDDHKTSDEDAELLQGIYLADKRKGRGNLAITNAVKETATCGVGAYMYREEFVNPGDPENDDMRIVWSPIFNAYNSVYWDKSAQNIDKSDARWCTILKTYTIEEFHEVFGDDEIASSAYKPWNRAYNNRDRLSIDFVYVATRYEVIKKREPVFTYNNLKTGEVEVYSVEDHGLIEDELKADEFRVFIRERKIIRQSVWKTVFSGDKILEKRKRISGAWIPVVPMYGYHGYVDGVEWYRGLVRKLKDAARLVNMIVSQIGENAASGGQKKAIFTPEQMENPAIQALWADLNNAPYLLANPVIGEDGAILHAGPTGYLDPGQLDGNTSALFEIASSFLQGQTGGAPQDTLDPDASGKAIRALMKRENMNTQIVNDNIASGIEWGGTVYESKATEHYNSQRMMRIIGKDGGDSQIQMHKTVLDEETGRQIEANTLQGKKFQAYSDTGPAYSTLREEAAENNKAMIDTFASIPAAQEYIPVLMASMIENSASVGDDPLKEFNRKIMLVRGMVEPENEEEAAIVAQAQQPQEDPNKELTEAVANQQNSEARERDSKSIDNVASANKKEAETAKIFAEISNSGAELSLKENEQLLKLLDIINEEQRTEVEALPFER